MVLDDSSLLDGGRVELPSHTELGLADLLLNDTHRHLLYLAFTIIGRASSVRRRYKILGDNILSRLRVLRSDR